MRITDGLKAAALTSLCVVMLAGCDTFHKSGVAGSEGRVVTLADGRQVVVSDNTKLTPPNKSKDDKSKSKKTKKKETADITAGGDREAVAVIGDGGVPPVSVADTVAVASGDLMSVSVEDFSFNGEWTIYSVRGNLVTGEERPYVTFDLPVSRFYGNNGCNYINGDLTVGADRSIKFGNMISTMKMCQDDQFQYLINLALADVVSYDVRYEKPVTFLDLKDADGRQLLVLRRHNMDFLNGAWKVAELNATPLVQDDDATMTFDTSGLKIHGTTGCNIFNGELFIDPDKTSSLQILRLATTRMMCAPDSRETEFLLALESVETARPSGGNGDVVLYSADGAPLFKLVRLELRDPSEGD